MISKKKKKKKHSETEANSFESLNKESLKNLSKDRKETFIKKIGKNERLYSLVGKIVEFPTRETKVPIDESLEKEPREKKKKKKRKNPVTWSVNSSGLKKIERKIPVGKVVWRSSKGKAGTAGAASVGDQL